MGAKSAASCSNVASGTAVTLPLGQVDDLRFGPELLQEPEGAGAPGEPRDLAAGVGKVTEDDGPGRARSAAGVDDGPVEPREGHGRTDGGTEHVYAAPGNPKRGEDLFTKKRCVECHSIRGHGGSIGPDLGIKLKGSLTQITGAMWN